MSQPNTKQVCSKINTPVSCKILRQSAFTTSLRDRPVVFSPQHVDDFTRKYSIGTYERRHIRVDEGSLLMTNDPNSIFYRLLSEQLQNTGSIDTRSTYEKEKLKLFEKYDPELVKFLKDREGNLKSKYDKVFIT
ncbi:unnamed protein product [Rotaria sp. Silwood2]|nr:unnamed protein product [Rotaria sp. Silwood2]CAF3098593.1 unnamed protein product [Rotaria sp. Silwood2]CAF3229618.1 unnamed protein product [Rotaria sp. Silwood2]CAF3276755.1 unnamed protein product [Rotaria sp. Silwood2]CAF4485517.1 unnamed protein product [Rotaria sp. Silwood2]